MDTMPPPAGRVAVPGCGRGHDVRFLARRGYAAVGFDFSPVAITAARALAERENVTATFEQRDLFGLPDDRAETFDGVWEYTCFCAIDPPRRPEYVRVIASLLRPGGWLSACFYPIRAAGGGPPFPVATDEVERLFSPLFHLEHAAPPLRSPPRRRGEEWMVLARRR
jgi:SAM-dependent methyltransferase